MASSRLNVSALASLHCSRTSLPTPYGWPARSSFFGIVDLAGFPKDVYYLYQSEWTDKQVLHLFTHWNWTPGQEIDMWCYYNQADEVELFVNGKSQGVKRKDLDNLHVARRVKFEPGTVKVIARESGKVVAEKEICTAAKPAEIRLTPDRSILTNLSFPHECFPKAHDSFHKMNRQMWNR